jgi:hypothetical protein
MAGFDLCLSVRHVTRCSKEKRYCPVERGTGNARAERRQNSERKGPRGRQCPNNPRHTRGTSSQV